jgi:hypothetical protein
VLPRKKESGERIMTDCRECGGTGREITGLDRSGDVPVLTYERCRACGDFFDAITDADNAMRRGNSAPDDYTMNLLYDRSEALFAVAAERCNHAIQEAAA